MRRASLPAANPNKEQSDDRGSALFVAVELILLSRHQAGRKDPADIP